MFLEDDEKKALQERLIAEEEDSPLMRALVKLLGAHPAESGGEVDFGAKVPESLFNEFKQYFPQYGATKWFINTALSRFLLRTRRHPEIRHMVELAVDDIRFQARTGQP